MPSMRFSPIPVVLVLLWGCATAPRPSVSSSLPPPPVARRIPHSVTVHGDTRQDDYAWLRERDNPEVLAYLEAENAYSLAAMRSLSDFEERLYQEMIGRIQWADTSVPYRKGDFLYYSRIEQGRPYALHYRRRASPEGPEELLLDLNVLAQGHPYFKLREFQVSDDGRWLAYSVDTTGKREYTLSLKDLSTGALLPERRELTYNVAWASDNRTLFFTTENAAHRSDKLWRHVLGEEGDTLVHEEKDEGFNLYLARSRSGEYFFIESSSWLTSEVWVLPCRESTVAPRRVAPREPGHVYYLEHQGARFYIRTNSTGPNFRIVTAPVDAPGRENWKELLPTRDTVSLSRMAMFSGHLVLLETEDGLSHLSVTELASGERHRLRLPEQVYEVSFDKNQQWDTQTLRVRYESPVTPTTTFDYDMGTRQRVLLKQEAVVDYEPSRYTTERLHVTAADGTRIPVSLVYRQGLRRDGSAPMYLKGYGAFGSTASMDFFSNDLSMLERGVVIATAHVRGGGELGERWHDAGRLRNKMNTFTDFISVAEALIAQGYTSRERLAIWGGSAGGLLVGTVLNLRPDLFRVALVHVPFVDVLNTLLDPTLPLTVPDYEEFGNPTRPEDYAAIKRYCPYTHVKAQAYPAMMVLTGLHDSQVSYWESAKWVAKLRANRTDSRPLLLEVNMKAGHTGSNDRYESTREVAHTLAFVLSQVGIER